MFDNVIRKIYDVIIDKTQSEKIGQAKVDGSTKKKGANQYERH